LGGEYEMISEGKLTIHGVEKERIIKGTIIIKNNKMVISSKFNVPLKDHNINIPTIVNEKISESIDVSVSVTLVPKAK
jgi:polyisoprenoid-binding protein YceI